MIAHPYLKLKLMVAKFSGPALVAEASHTIENTPSPAVLGLSNFAKIQVVKTNYAVKLIWLNPSWPVYW